MKLLTRTVVSVWIVGVLLLAIARADDIPLSIQGDTETVVKKLPFFVVAPAGADLYFWTAPAGVEFVEKGESLLVSKAPTGRLLFGLKTLTIDWDAKKVHTRTGSISVVVGDLPPDPEPGPGPNPDPPKPDPTPPTPIIKTLFVVVVEETKDAAANRGSYMANKSLHDYIKAKNYKARVVDKDIADSNGSTPKELAPYITFAKTQSLPYVFLVSQDGDVVFRGSLPKTPDELLTLIKKVGG